MDDGGIAITSISALRDVPRADWDAIANPPATPYNPFLSWDFLEALETAGCASAAEGWAPRHILARDAQGRLIGALPAYLKSHSYGEYVFDHAWADALHRAGGRYYPKLQTAVPFTPATGRRILAAHPDSVAALAQGAIALAQAERCSSWHTTFLSEAEWRALGGLGLLQRTGVQFHWANAGYESFEAFLATLSSGKRKTIRRERRDAVEGLTIRRKTGAAITEADWDFFFRCYMDTGSRKWGSPYLNRRFFSLIGERMAEKIVLIVAETATGKPIAAALNFIGGDCLYGRYWGRVWDQPFLHFELCYYQAIDIAIEMGLPRVEAGAQGEHKLARGYAPVATYSTHWIAHPGLREAVARYLEAERPAIADEIDLLAEHTPFKKIDIAGETP